PIFQVLQLLQRERGRAEPCAGTSGASDAPPPRAPDRALVPHLPVHELHDRGVPGPLEGGTEPPRLRGLRPLLPTDGRGAHRTPLQPPPTVPPGRRVRRRAREAGA